MSENSESAFMILCCSSDLGPDATQFVSVDLRMRELMGIVAV